MPGKKNQNLVFSLCSSFLKLDFATDNNVCTKIVCMAYTVTNRIVELNGRFVMPNVDF